MKSELTTTELLAAISSLATDALTLATKGTDEDFTAIFGDIDIADAVADRVERIAECVEELKARG